MDYQQTSELSVVSEDKSMPGTFQNTENPIYNMRKTVSQLLEARERIVLKSEI